MKKLFAVLLSIVIVLTMGTVALAAGTDKGTITITNAVTGAEYTVYKMLSFIPVDENGTKGVYRPNGGWQGFFENSPVAANYFTIEYDSMGVPSVSLKNGVDAVDQTVAQAALQYAVDNDLAPAKDAIKATSSTVEFTDLDLGYYVIDTTVGTMAALTRASNELTIVEKNEKPGIDKFVQEDSEINNVDEGWGKVNDAKIGQEVNYKSVITVGLGAVNYIMHDTMEEGLTFDPDSVVVEGATAGTDYEVVTSCGVEGCDCTFAIKFKDSYIATKNQGDKIVVTYSATLNDNANIVDDGNDNTVYLSCGEKNEWTTEPATTTTYTWKLDVFKYTMEGENQTPLAGATFVLHDYEINAELTFSEVEGEVPTYMVDPDGTITSITTTDDGKFVIVGLDEGTYGLVETDPPEGYNTLGRSVEITITSEYDEEKLEATYKINGADPAQVEVENKTGGLFPETGGIGTTIFYVVGALLMLAAVVVLVSKKRMATFA